MLEITRKITLDLARRSNTRLVFATQNDLNSRHLSITLTDDGRPYRVPSDCIVTINVKRPDLSQKAFRCSVGEGGTVEYTIDSWALSGEGEIKCSISIYSNEHQKLTSSPFTLDVAPSLCLDSAITEDENFSLLTTLIQDITEANESEKDRIEAEAQRSSAEQLRQSAETERAQAEALRVKAENKRAAAESERAEYRDYQERRLTELEDQSQKNAKRLTNIEDWMVFNPFVTDNDTAYSKNIPHDSCPYAQIFEIGGMTRSIPIENMLKPPYYHPNGHKHNGITFTVSDDGTITANGTKENPDAPAIFYISKTLPLDRYKTYYFTGAPASAATMNHYIWVNNNRDTGSGTMIKSATVLDCHIFIDKDISVNNLQFKPFMYEGDSAIPLSDLRTSAVYAVEVGCRNLFSLPYYDASGSIVGVTFNANSDGSVELSGKCTLPDEGLADYNLVKGIKLPAGTYSLSGCPNGGGMHTYRAVINILRANKTASYYSDTGDGVTFDIYDGDIVVAITIRIGSQIDLSNPITFYPMLVHGSVIKEFHPHHEPTVFSIPVAVRNIEGYGDGINGQYYNKLVFNKENNEVKFIQTVARRAYKSGDENLANVITNGMETLYALANPIETAIDVNVLDGGLIEVEPGGTLRFVNAIESAVPSRITYMIKGDTA
jgi:hypothetical protein